MRAPFALRWWSVLAALGFGLGTVAIAQDLVINELMAAGQSVVPDEEGAFPDWIEIANVGSAPVNLAGWHLTDAADQPAKWTFPGRILPPGEYLIVFASGRNRTGGDGPLHTSFSLKSGGEYLALIRPNGSVESSTEYPVQLPDISYEPAGQRLFGEPTPGAANDTEPLALATAPAFSEEHGFRDEPFLLTLTTSTPAATVRFTTDGSEPSETNGTVYAAPIRIAKTSVIRAAAFAPGSQPSPVVTRTYLFIDDIVTQSLDGKAPKGFPKKWGMNRVDNGLDPRIATRAPYKKTIKDDLRTIPSLSIVMDPEDLFDPVEGIYSNALNKGSEWERPMSLELIHPDGTTGFQVNAGVRIRGGASRDAGNPKHSFRVLMRKEYGAPALKYPLFGESGAQSTERFDLRCEQLVAWHYFVDPQADFIRDIYGRDTQGALGQPYKRGDFHHLYINGQYWGLYQTDERVTAEYAAEYFGGDEEDYDVVKFDSEASFGTGFTDGTFGSWRRLFDAGKRGFVENVDYFKVQGQNPDGSRNRSYERLLDVDNLIDYMLAGIFICADDSPPSFGTQNNWYGLRSRKDNFGFRFFAHDWEISMSDQTENRVGPPPEANPFDDQFADPGSVNPWHYWEALRFNEEFRLRVADHVQRFFFNGGPLTREAAQARWQRRMDEIDRAVVGESARWGDARQGGIHPFKNALELVAAWREGLHPENRIGAGGIIIDPLPEPNPTPKPGGPGGTGKNPKPFTREDWFLAANDRVLNGFLAERSEHMLQHLRDGGLFPSIPAPVIDPHGGSLPENSLVTISVPETPSENRIAVTEIYYTTDGTDPRRVGGAVSAEARLYSAPFALARTTTIKARTKAAAEWSALVEVQFTPGVDFRALQVTEIHYNHPGSGGVLEQDAEFLELKNTGAVPLDLSGATFTAGIDYTFPSGSVLPPGAMHVLIRSSAAFDATYPGVNFHSVYQGRLNDDGETIALVTATGARIFSVSYDDEMPWPLAPDLLGFTLVRANFEDPDRPTSWRVSLRKGGSPGVDDNPGVTFPAVVVNEVLTRPVAGAEKAVELLNTSPTPADISGWWLSNDPASPRQFRIPNGTLLAPGGFVVFTESVLESGATPMVIGSLPGAVYLFGADAQGNPSSYAHGLSYAGLHEGVSVGRHVNSEGVEQFPAMTAVTFGAANPAPRTSSLRIAELQYFPPGGSDEFIEIENRAGVAASLAGASLSGVAYPFPETAEVPAFGRALVVMKEPATFRAEHKVPADVPIYGPAPGVLQDNGERVELRLPIVIDGILTYAVAESVRYNDRRPWPTGAAGFGASLQRITPATYGDDPESWLAGRPSPGEPNQVNSPPRIELTSPANDTVYLPPRIVTFAAEASDADGTIAKVEFLVDNIVIGEDDSAPFSMQWRPSAGLHDLTARAIDDQGAATESDFVTIDVDAPELGIGRGLTGEYFKSTDLTGAPVIRDDAQIRFDWAERPPVFGFEKSNYSVRWTGRLLPRSSGDHVLFVRASGGVRLFVNDELLIDQWDESAETVIGEYLAQVALVGGVPADLRLEYVERDGFGNIALLWSEPTRFEAEIIGQNQLLLNGQDPDALGIASAGDISARRLGRTFRTQLQGTNGTRPYTWSADADAVPPGVSLSPGGVLSGSPSAVGLFEFEVALTDSAGAVAQRRFRIPVVDEPSQLSPRVTITSPDSDSKIGEEPVRITGSSVAPRGLAELRYSVNGGPWHSFFGGPRWSVVVDEVRGLQPGRNQVRVIAIDVEGRESAAAKRTFTRVVRSALVVGVEGEGTVTRSFLGTTHRVIGQEYTITATPAPGFVLAEWRGAFGFERRLRFTMEEGLELTAVFVPNPYRSLAGPYVAPLTAETPDHRSRGLLTMEVGSTGGFTGKLSFGGRRYPLKGALAPDGSAFISVFSDELRFLALSLQMNLETAALDARVGESIDIEYFEGTGIGSRADYDVRTAPCEFAGNYAVSLQSTGPSSDASLTISPSGHATLTGALPDGTPWKSAGQIRRDGILAIYVPLDQKAGSLSGTLQLSGLASSGGTGALFLSRLATPPGIDPDTTDFAVTIVAQP
jgi:hypothetical protein